MRIRALLWHLVLFITCLQLSAAQLPIKKIKHLYERKQYFELRDTLAAAGNDHSKALLFYRGAVDNKFNRLNRSIIHLQDFLKQAGGQTDNNLVVDGYRLLADNYIKTHQYRKAGQAYQEILTKYRHTLDKKAEDDIKNSALLWQALADVPPQTAVFAGESKIQSIKGRFPFEINGHAIPLSFDTGANLSVLIESLARRFKLEIIDISIDVEAVSGKKVKAKIGIASKMKLGSVTLHHVVFLIFEDKNLYFPEINYQGDGVIGFPVISALREIIFLGKKEIIIPVKPTTYSQQNLCLEELTPLIAGRYRGKRFTFVFDTGANQSFLYPPFYRRYEKEIKKAYTPGSEKIRGVSGYKEIPAYRLKNLQLTLAGKKVHFNEIPVLTEYTLEESHYFYGNLGQDASGQFEKMIVSFGSMSIIFE
jgi:hypothetical protein